jgi:hypothetical protein
VCAIVATHFSFCNSFFSSFLSCSVQVPNRNGERASVATNSIQEYNVELMETRFKRARQQRERK